MVFTERTSASTKLTDNSGTDGVADITIGPMPPPTLFISHLGNAVTLYCQDVAGWVLQQNSNLTVSTD